MRFGSLFAGIGGMDLGLERAGMTCAWQVEIDPYAQKVLAKHWPNVDRVADIRLAHGTCFGVCPEKDDGETCLQCLYPVDLICGGFPCQDISNAGKRAGIDGERSGLWSEYARIVREVRPRYVLVENVSALLARGLGRVLGDLAASGYDAEWDCIPAAAVGAPHRRDRLFVVAYAQREPGRLQPEPKPRRGDPAVAGFDGAEGSVADADSGRLEVERLSGLLDGEREAQRDDAHRRGGAEVADAASQRRREGRPQPERARAAVFSSSGLKDFAGHWATEPAVGRVAHGVPRRVDRLRCLGNAVVPQVAEFIGRRILEHATQTRQEQ